MFRSALPPLRRAAFIASCCGLESGISVPIFGESGREDGRSRAPVVEPVGVDRPIYSHKIEAKVMLFRRRHKRAIQHVDLFADLRKPGLFVSALAPLLHL